MLLALAMLGKEVARSMTAQWSRHPHAKLRRCFGNHGSWCWMSLIASIHLLEIVDEIGDGEEAGVCVAHMLFYFFQY